MTDTTSRNRRSLVVCSALDEQRYRELLCSGADMVCLDLEDGTAAPHKSGARESCLRLFAESAPEHVQRLLRVNTPHSLDGIKDLHAVAELEVPPDCLVLPKVADPADVRMVADVLDDAGRTMELIPLIEDQAGVRNARAIAAASSRVAALFLGTVDLSGELRSDMGWDALLRARQCLVEATSECAVDCIDGPWLDADDLGGLNAELTRLAAMGFTGKASYDTSQIDSIHRAFTPSPEQIDFAERVIAAVRTSATGVARIDGKSVNKANAKGAMRVLALATRRGVLRASD